MDDSDVYDLLRGRLRFANVAAFNDPFEARPQYVAAHTDSGRQRKAMLEYLTSIAPVEGSQVRKQKWAENLLRGKSMQEVVETAERESRQHGWQNESRVLCLMAIDTVSTPLPWSHYGDSHRGVCVHFTTSEYPLRFAFPVEYGPEYPALLVPRTAMDNWDNVRNVLLRKCDLWAYEREFRVMRFVSPAGSISDHLCVTWDGAVAIAPKNIARAITLGCRMDAPTRHRLISWIKENAPHVEVWQAELHRNRYEIVRNRAE